MLIETITLVNPGFDSIKIIIERKKVKNSRLKIFPSLEVKLSVPYSASTEWIEKYLQSKKDWIWEKLDKFSKTKGYETTEIIKHGMSIRMLGQDMIFTICKSDKKLIYKEYSTIYIFIPEPSDTNEIMCLFKSWWKKQAFSVYNDVLSDLYPVIEKHKIIRPKLLVRKMRTLWGSSSPHNGTITLNMYLLKARKPCIEYVVLHEISHFLYPSHNRQFYDFLTFYMPDWEERKRYLDTEVVQGL